MRSRSKTFHLFSLTFSAIFFTNLAKIFINPSSMCIIEAVGSKITRFSSWIWNCQSELHPWQFEFLSKSSTVELKSCIHSPSLSSWNFCFAFTWPETRESTSANSWRWVFDFDNSCNYDMCLIDLFLWSVLHFVSLNLVEKQESYVDFHFDAQICFDSNLWNEEELIQIDVILLMCIERPFQWYKVCQIWWRIVLEWWMWMNIWWTFENFPETVFWSSLALLCMHLGVIGHAIGPRVQVHTVARCSLKTLLPSIPGYVNSTLAFAFFFHHIIHISHALLIFFYFFMPLEKSYLMK